jgi:alpha-1,2-mannosyltransferase
MTSADLAGRMESFRNARGWGLPIASAAIALVVTTVMALTRLEIDLGTYLMGGAHAFSGRLYQLSYRPTGLGFTYPPFAAMLFAPASHLSERMSQVAFSWVSLGCLFGLVYVSLRALRPGMERRTVLWWALVLLIPAGLLDPIRQTMMLGQLNLVLALMVVADMTLELKLPRGVLVGLAAAIKLTPIILIPYLFMTRQARAGWRSLGVFAAAAALAAAVSPHASSLYWTHDIGEPSRAGWLAWIGNQGVVGVVDRLVAHQLTTVSEFALIALVGAIGLGIAALAFRQSSPVLGFLVVEATESLASPVSWSHHFIWIVLLIGWLALGTDRPAYGEWWSLAVAAFFWAGPVWWVNHGSGHNYAGRGWLIPLSDSYFFLLVGFVVAAAVLAAHRRSASLRRSAVEGRRHHSDPSFRGARASLVSVHPFNRARAMWMWAQGRPAAGWSRNRL